MIEEEVCLIESAVAWIGLDLALIEQGLHLIECAFAPIERILPLIEVDLALIERTLAPTAAQPSSRPLLAPHQNPTTHPKSKRKSPTAVDFPCTKHHNFICS
ncbi:hypothetical protein JNUCC1_01026 [Lentibacillus sp. JNUCC-1]|nr:hypothetical protein [Lentibacillus sp. JNUCC-1]